MDEDAVLFALADVGHYQPGDITVPAGYGEEEDEQDG